MAGLRTYVYVDGFNLYYGSLKGTRNKWINILDFVGAVVGPRYDISRIKYYTALVSGKFDQQHPRRQREYLNALSSVPEIEIFYGNFLAHQVNMPLCKPDANGRRTARVMKMEEKGSDVNLASHLIHDAHRKLYEAAVVVSCDTDLVEPVRIVTREIGLHVCLIPPRPNGSKSLKQVSSTTRHISPAHLTRSQFPPSVTTPKGIANKPADW